MMTFYHIWAIARTEYRLQWRRRGLLVMTLAMLVVSGFSTVMLKNEIGARDVLADQVGASTVGLISFTLLPVSAVLAMVMPFVLADAVPNDRHLGIFELLTTMPMSRSLYLAGKLMGVMLSVFSGISVIFIFTAGLWRALIGPFNFIDYLEAWLMAGLLVAVVNIGLSVLLGALLPDARRAVVIIVVVFVLIPALLGFDPQGNWRDSFNPLRPGIFYRYTYDVAENANRELDLLPVSITLVTAFAQVALAWFMAQWWMKRQEG